MEDMMENGIRDDRKKMRIKNPYPNRIGIAEKGQAPHGADGGT